MTITLRFLAGAAPNTKGLALINVEPRARPAAERRKSRRVQARRRAISRGAAPVANISNFRSAIMHFTRRLRPGGRSGLRRRDKLLDLGPFLVEFGQMLCPQALINVEFLLGAIFLAGVNIVLAKTVMRVGQIGVQVEGADVFGYSHGVIALVRVEVAELYVSFGQLRIERNSLLEQGFYLVKIEVGVLSTLPLPQAHRVIVGGMGVVGLEFVKAAESPGYIFSLVWRTIVSLGKKIITARIGGIKVGGREQRFDCVVVLTARVQRHAQSDLQPGRIRKPLGSYLEALDGRLVGTVKKKLAPPVKEIVFAWIHVGGG